MCTDAKRSCDYFLMRSDQYAVRSRNCVPKTLLDSMAVPSSHALKLATVMNFGLLESERFFIGCHCESYPAKDGFRNIAADAHIRSTTMLPAVTEARAST